MTEHNQTGLITASTVEPLRAHTVTGQWEIGLMARFKHKVGGWHITFGPNVTLDGALTHDEVAVHAVSWALLSEKAMLVHDANARVTIVWQDPAGTVGTTTVQVDL